MQNKRNAMCTIKLSGRLAQLFGREHRYHLESGTTTEAFSALRNTLEGFREAIAKAEKLGMRYAIFRNRRNVGTDEFELGGTEEIRVVPVLAGSKRGGILQTIVGAVLIVAGTYFQQPWLVNIGAALAVGGVVQMLSPQSTGLKGREDPDNKPSYAFGGPVNTTAMGNPVGILAGRRRIGGAIISAGIYAEDVT